MPVWSLAALGVTLPLLAGVGARYLVHGDLNAIHLVLSLFLSTNLLICGWEACLFLQRDVIAARAAVWRQWHRDTGRSPVGGFLSARVPCRRVLSPAVWADVWATYSLFDGSFSDRRSFGFSADVGNGFVTLIPTLVLYAAFTLGILPAVAAGILGLMLFWQWTYVTSVYWVSFFLAGRHRRVTRVETLVWIGAVNAPWVLCPLLGLGVSIRLVLDGNYAVLGF